MADLPPISKSEAKRLFVQRGLPEQVCEYGFSYEQLQEILGPMLPDYQLWARGATSALCPDHGAVSYPHDVKSFLRGERNLD